MHLELIELRTQEKKLCFVAGMFQNDTVLWKAARAAVHHLLITGKLIKRSEDC